MPGIKDFKKAWNMFFGRDPTMIKSYYEDGVSSSYNPIRSRYIRGDAKSVTNSVYNQIAVDVASIDIRHVRLDDEDRYKETINDSLNRALTKDANIDQTGREFIKDAVISMLDEGVVALVPFICDTDPNKSDSYKIFRVRTAKILEWKPHHIYVHIYNENTGLYEDRWVEKSICAIPENPFYEIMNQPNGTAQRLIRVLSQLDRTNEQNSAGKIDLLVQLPYTIKNQAKKNIAETRRKDIEAQLTGSQHGIAYIDSTEKVIQLNRSIENNLWVQAKELTAQLYNELGFSESIFNGTADEQTMINYNNRTIEPILTVLVEEMERKWISLTAQTQGQAIRFFKDPFKLVPVSKLAEMADKLTRNEIMSSNEIRSVIGLKPSSDPKADQLINSNLNQSKETINVKKDVAEEISHSVDDELYHYGMPQRSGRYPYGSGDRPYQNGVKLVNNNNTYKFEDRNGKTASELKVFDFKIKGFDWILIADVETDPSYRRKGLATKLVNQAYSDIKKKNNDKGLYLFVKDDNKNAIDMYEKLNFKFVKDYELKDGKYRIMAKGDANEEQLRKMNFS